jgi:hypothetical protein
MLCGDPYPGLSVRAGILYSGCIGMVESAHRIAQQHHVSGLLMKNFTSIDPHQFHIPSWPFQALFGKYRPYVMMDLTGRSWSLVISQVRYQHAVY